MLFCCSTHELRVTILFFSFWYRFLVTCSLVCLLQGFYVAAGKRCESASKRGGRVIVALLLLLWVRKTAFVVCLLLVFSEMSDSCRWTAIVTIPRGCALVRPAIHISSMSSERVRVWISR